MTDYAQSALSRLKNKWKEEGPKRTPFDRTLMKYAMERFLYRLSQSSYKDQFVLKGGILFYIWTNREFRPTKDLVFLYYGHFDRDELLEKVKFICAIEFPEDGLSFDSFRAIEIKEDHEYEGVRINFRALLNKVSINMQLDISTGDRITPKASKSEFPQLLNMDAPSISTYPIETVFAEKLEAIVKLDLLTSRMKDVYDLYILVTTFKEILEVEVLGEAINTTFNHRKTDIPEVPVSILTHRFYEDKAKITQWKAFISKSSFQVGVEEAINTIADFVNPIINELKLK